MSSSPSISASYSGPSLSSNKSKFLGQLIGCFAVLFLFGLFDLLIELGHIAARGSRGKQIEERLKWAQTGHRAVVLLQAISPSSA
jgi:hypothetical protein